MYKRQLSKQQSTHSLISTLSFLNLWWYHSTISVGFTALHLTFYFLLYSISALDENSCADCKKYRGKTMRFAQSLCWFLTICTIFWPLDEVKSTLLFTDFIAGISDLYSCMLCDDTYLTCRSSVCDGPARSAGQSLCPGRWSSAPERRNSCIPEIWTFDAKVCLICCALCE